MRVGQSEAAMGGGLKEKWVEAPAMTAGAPHLSFRFNSTAPIRFPFFILPMCRERPVGSTISHVSIHNVPSSNIEREITEEPLS